MPDTGDRAVQHIPADSGPGLSEEFGQGALERYWRYLFIVSWTIAHKLSIHDRSRPEFREVRPAPPLHLAGSMCQAAVLAKNGPQLPRRSLTSLGGLFFSRRIIRDVAVLPLTSST